jgi:fructose 1,6-bisphosphate aldolase/phosphatase
MWPGSICGVTGPFEPHRLPLDEMEYTTMPQVAKKLEGRFEALPE